MVKKDSNFNFFVSIFLIFILMLSFFSPFVVAGLSDSFQNPTNSYQYSEPTQKSSLQNNISSSNNLVEECNSNIDADFKIIVTECSPSVVTSNLLAEQDVPVYCQLEAIRLNSLIQASSISSITFDGEYPKGVKSISYHPARASINSGKSILLDDVFENIGYVVVVLNKQPNEDNLTKYISSMLTAKMRYTFSNGYDISESVLYLDLDNKDGVKESLFSGAGNIYVKDYGSDTVSFNVDLLTFENFENFQLSKGETSPVYYLPGYDCKAGFSVSFNDIVMSKDRVLLSVDDKSYWLREGDSFLNGKCVVKDISKTADSENRGIFGSVNVLCSNTNFNLELKKLGKTESKEEPIDSNIDSQFSSLRNNIIDNLNYLTGNYPYEKIEKDLKSEGFEYYAEKALYEGIILSGELGQYATQKDLVKIFLEKYKDSNYFNKVNQMLEKAEVIDYSSSSKIVEWISGEKNLISLKEFKFLKNEISVDVSVDKKAYTTLKEGDSVKEEFPVKILEIYSDNVVFLFGNERVIMKKGESHYFKDSSNLDHYLNLDKINYLSTAKITINPKIGNGYTSANFSFNIPIEKRTFSLTPEQAAKKAKSMDDFLRITQGILDAIEVAVRGWNLACKTVRTYMTIKMISESFGVKGIARRSVTGFVKQFCRDNVSSQGTGSYESIDECLLGESDRIEQAVKNYKEAIDAAQEEFNKKKAEMKKTNREIKDDKIIDKIRIGEVKNKIDGKEVSRTISDSQLEKLSVYNKLIENDKSCEGFACKAVLKEIKSDESYFATATNNVVQEPEKGSTESSQTTTEKCSNAITQNKEVRYYEDGVNKGLAAIVPFNTTGGWYAYVSSSYGAIFQEQAKSYNSNGQPNNFYICNVGNDGAVDEISEDVCQSFSINQNSFDNFIGCSGLSSTDVKNLYNSALTAISSANKQYGSDSINILGQVLSVGENMLNVLNFECIDFLSPKDCKIIQGVCDWVECPSSRCNAGGKINVPDVTQTGVFGSIALCLPGFVCLPGIYAGLDSIVSMIKEYQDCLNTRATTGEYVGSCDRIRSFYICEFVTKQVISFVKGGITSLFSGTVSNLIGGGGEYLSFKSENRELKAIAGTFIAQFISNSANNLFSINLDNFSGSICHGYIGEITTDSSSSNSGFSIDSLLNSVWESTSLETGYQIFSTVSEKSYTDSTVPPISQYNVFYNIYVGSKDVSYNIYLSEPPSISSYSSYGTHSVGRGSIKAGESKSESLDFTAPSGYKKLCIVVNGEINCDFGITSTNYGINTIIDSFVKEELTSNIKTERECLSASSGIVLNTLQGDSVLENEGISNIGIDRVCATSNPSVETIENTADSRWYDVGYCGDEKIRCWLDTKTLVNVLSTVDSEELKNIAVSKKTLGIYDNFADELKLLKNKISEAGNDKDKINTTLSEINNLKEITSGAKNSQIAEIYYYIFNLYSRLCRISYNDKADSEKIDSRGSESLQNTKNTESTPGSDILFSLKEYGSDKLDFNISGNFLYYKNNKDEFQKFAIFFPETGIIYDLKNNKQNNKIGQIDIATGKISISEEYKTHKIGDLTYGLLEIYKITGGKISRPGFYGIYYDNKYIDLELVVDIKMIYNSIGTKIGSLDSNDKIIIDDSYDSELISGTDFKYSYLENYKIIDNKFYYVVNYFLLKKDGDPQNTETDYVYFNDDSIYANMYIKQKEIYNSNAKRIGSLDSNGKIIIDDFYNDALISGTNFKYSELEKYEIDKYNFLYKGDTFSIKIDDSDAYYIYLNNEYVNLYILNNEVYDFYNKKIGGINSNGVILINSEYEKTKIVNTQLEYNILEKYRVVNGVLSKDVDDIESGCLRSGNIWLVDEGKCVNICDSDSDCANEYACNRISGKCELK